MDEILVRSTLDGTLQPSLFFHPGGDAPVPLVVGLHTWSYDRFNQEKHYLPLARKYGCALLLPDFRGPNLTTNPKNSDACASRLARQDVIDAVKHVCGNYAVDAGNVFLLGCSGGGQMALIAAETAPELFRAVEVWCPVSDLTLWHEYLTERGKRYIRHIEACTGGLPAERPEEYAFRSPATRAEVLKCLPLSIHHGRHDPIVPFRHSVRFAKMVEEAGSDQVYLDVFDGGHEQIPQHSFEWFSKLVGKAKSAVGITG